jgi:hypothetical protein
MPKTVDRPGVGKRETRGAMVVPVAGHIDVLFGGIVSLRIRWAKVKCFHHAFKCALEGGGDGELWLVGYLTGIWDPSGNLRKIEIASLTMRLTLVLSGGAG